MANDENNWRRSVESEIRENWAAPIVSAGVPLTVVALKALQPAQGILQVAGNENAELVVLGTRGIGDVSGVRVGGVAIKVVHHTDRPVVLVPPTE